MKQLIISSIFLALSLTSNAAESLSKEALQAKAEAFIAAKNARQQPASTVKDVEHFLSFIADEFVDEHVRFNVTVTDKSEMRKMMIAKLKDKIIFSNMTIEQLMFGRDLVIVKYKEHAKGKPSHLDKAVEYQTSNIMTLEFNAEGKIKHIRRHHGM